MTPFTIRAMTVADIAQCAALMAATPLWQRYGVTIESAAARFEAGLQGDATILIAEAYELAHSRKHEIAGFVWITQNGAFGRSAYIPLIGVAEAFHGNGIGHQLLLAAEEKAGESSPDLFLLCSDFNSDAQRFYERQGYTRVGAIPDYVIAGVAEIIFYKRLM